MRDKIWDFIGKTIYQVQVRGEDKVGFPCKKSEILDMSTDAFTLGQGT